MQIGAKYHCDGKNCQNAIDASGLLKMYDYIHVLPAEVIQKAQTEFDRKVSAWGWKNINGKLFCKFCVNKAATV